MEEENPLDAQATNDPFSVDWSNVDANQVIGIAGQVLGLFGGSNTPDTANPIPNPQAAPKDYTILIVVLIIAVLLATVIIVKTIR